MDWNLTTRKHSSALVAKCVYTHYVVHLLCSGTHSYVMFRLHMGFMMRQDCQTVSSTSQTLQRQ